jgi:hypothetical protein
VTNRRAALLAGAVAAAIAGCHGATIHEAPPAGGAGQGGGRAGSGGAAGTIGAAGSGGGGGSGGSAGAAGSGGDGVGCAAQLTPELYYEGQSAPVMSDGTSTRYYWAEYDSPNFKLHYLLGSPPANEYTHPWSVDASVAGIFSFAVSDTRVVATWNDAGEVAVYGTDYDSPQIGSTLTLDGPSAVALSGTMVYYSHRPASGNPTPGIYQWQPPAGATLFESFSQLGSDATFGQILRTTPSKLLLSDRTDVRMVGLGTKGAAQVLFPNPGAQPVTDVRPARPHDHDGGVIVQTMDDLLFGRDYYVDITVPGNLPVDLGAATSALADASACGAAAHYHGPGVLYMQRYIYEGDSGLFAVNVSANGTVSDLVRLTDKALIRPEVTGAGDLFAVALTQSASFNLYYRVGSL